MKHPRERRVGRTAALFLLPVVATLGVAIAWAASDARGPEVARLGPGDDGLLPLPDVGRAAAGYLDDGTPVFVSRPETGEIAVVGATDHHLGDRLVAFCDSSGWFEEPYHGSRYNGWGEWTGGPAPSGLTPYPFEVVEEPGRTGVRVTGGDGTPPDRGAHYDHEQPPRGTSCEPGHGLATDAVAHRPPDDVPLVAPAEIPHGRWGWVRLETAGTVRQPRLCIPDTACDPGRALPTRVTVTSDEPLPRSRATWLARRDAAGTVELRWPGRPEDRRPEPLEPIGAGDDELLAPPHGSAAPGHLDDGTPVFVTRTPDGEVYVLDAASPLEPRDLVGYCRPAGLFADAGGGRWDLTGRHVAGPAGGNLASYRFLAYEQWSGTVVHPLGDHRTPPLRSTSDVDVAADPAAECGELQRH